MPRQVGALVIGWMMAALCFAMSEEKEVELGKAEHQKIVSQYGVYRHKELTDYVSRVGQRVAAESSRPGLEYHFTVLDDEMINAFALPGGYVYVTRGILAHLNSEAELAAVLGHEIAHVTEKHAIRNKNRGKLLGALTTVAAIYTGTPGLYELGNLFGGVLLTGYSREFELEADKVGAQFMAKAGYDPDAMLDTIEILKNKDRIEIEQARAEDRKPRVYHGFLSTHPDNDTRYKEAIKESENLLTTSEQFLGTEAFMKKLNGMTYGNPPKTGVVRGSTFYHPRLGIKMTFPDTWRIETNPRVFRSCRGNPMRRSRSPRREFQPMSTPRHSLKKVWATDLREGREMTVAGMPAFIGIAERARSPFGPRPVRLAVVFDERRRLAFILTGAGQYDLKRIANDREFIATIFSFDLMDEQDFREAKPPRLQIVRAEEGTTMESLAERSAITNYALDKLRVINGLYPDGQPKPGELIKIVD
ncbi:MAG: M48 family metalloprotease [Gammaproteobacteria bacterium]|nr:M48 family metalloprotease [Gammaproteobacteria bacterium]